MGRGSSLSTGLEHYLFSLGLYDRENQMHSKDSYDGIHMYIGWRKQ